MSYADYAFYTDTYGGTVITAEDAPKSLQKASETIDSLTYCRILEKGFEGLSGFQKGIIQRCACALAEWQTQNADILDNPYSSYSINGVSATWGKTSSVRQINGILIPNQIYSDLIKTGLCFPGVR